MKIITRPAAPKNLDKSIDKESLRAGMVVWSNELGLCIVASPDFRIAPHLVSLLSGVSYEVNSSHKYFNMANYCEITAENNYTQHFDFSY